MRIGIMANSLTGGGAERQASQWAQIIARWPDAELELLAVHDLGGLYALPADVAVTTARKRHPADLLRVARAVRKFVARMDVAITFQWYPAIFCIDRHDVPLLLVSGDDPRHHWDQSGIPNRIIAAAFRNAATASAPARQLIDCYEARGVRPRGPWLCVPNIADEAGFVEPAAEKSGVLFVGRLEPQKDPLLAIEACAAADLPLTILGDGSLREQVLAAARGRQVTLHPFTSTPWELYSKHRVLILSSAYEPFGNVLVESLAASTPVVSVDCDFGPREVLAGARYSTIVGSRDPDALGAALRAVVERAPGPEERDECATIAGRYRPAAVEPLIRDAVERTLTVDMSRRR